MDGTIGIYQQTMLSILSFYLCGTREEVKEASIRGEGNGDSRVRASTKEAKALTKEAKVLTKGVRGSIKGADR